MSIGVESMGQKIQNRWSDGFSSKRGHPKLIQLSVRSFCVNLSLNDKASTPLHLTLHEERLAPPFPTSHRKRPCCWS